MNYEKSLKKVHLHHLKTNKQTTAHTHTKQPRKKERHHNSSEH